jgi:hypothetical protein
MHDKLSGSVGKNASNDPTDVTVVQRLLLEHGFKLGRADGICGPKTLGAILAFQRGFLKSPDGTVDPGGTTWHHLGKISHSHPPMHTGSPFTRLIPRPPKNTLNPGLTAANNAYMTEAFGCPRDTYSDQCQDITNVKLKRNIVVDTVGKFRVQGLAPAVSSLQDVFAEIKAKQADVYDVLGTEGMLCCRYVRNSKVHISNHSWGTAIDLTIAGVLDKRGDGLVQYGMSLIAPIFNQFGWYWGAAFPTEDGMHFEGSKKLIDEWKNRLK